MSAANPSPMNTVQPPADLLLDREAKATALVSGPWSLWLRGADLDNIAYHGTLVLRSIRLIVRDEDWGTLPMRLEESGRAAGFRIVGNGSELILSGLAGTLGDVCAWTVTVRVEGASLRVKARVEATTRFRRNRLGLIVLHPPELAGYALTVEHPDGSATETLFPEHISAHQPARDIRNLSWRSEQPVDGRGSVESSLKFSGDVFEMEDQRNWTDASFKTYSTPLSKPFPVTLEPGTVIEQSVELWCNCRGADVAVLKGHPARAQVTFAPASRPGRLPNVTTSVSSGPSAGHQSPASLWPLLAELDPETANWRAALDRAAAQSSGRPLDLRLIVECADEAIPLLSHIRHQSIALARIGIFSRRTHISEPGLLDALPRLMHDHGVSAEVIGGTRAHFTELNRHAHRLAGWDGPLSFSMTPFMHDRGGHQLVESIAMQRILVRDAIDIARGRPLHIGPITLGPRFNAVATSPPSTPMSDSLETGFGAELIADATDPRQSAPSLGAWILASISVLAIPGVETLSYFEASGERGLITAGGQSTSAAQVLGWIAELSGNEIIPIASDHPAIVGFAVATHDVNGGSVAVIGNLGDTPLVVRAEGIADLLLESGSVRRVDVSLA